MSQRKNFTVLLAIFCLMNISLFSQARYSIKGNFSNDSLRWNKAVVSKVILAILDDKGEYEILDTVPVNDKQFEFTGNIPDKMVMHFIGGFDNGYAIIFPDSDSIRVTLDARFPNGATIEGSRTTVLFQDYRKQVKDEMNALFRTWMNEEKQGKAEDYHKTRPGMEYNSFLSRLSELKYNSKVIGHCIKNKGEVIFPNIVEVELSDFFNPHTLSRMFSSFFDTSMKDHPYYQDLQKKIKPEEIYTDPIPGDNTISAKSCKITGTLTTNSQRWSDTPVTELCLERKNFEGKTYRQYATVKNNRFSFEIPYPDANPYSMMFIKGFDNGTVLLFSQKGEIKLNVDGRFPNRSNVTSFEAPEKVKEYYSQVAQVFAEEEKQKEKIFTAPGFEKSKTEELSRRMECITYARYVMTLLDFIVDNRNEEDMLLIMRDEFVSKVSSRYLHMKRLYPSLINPNYAKTPVAQEIFSNMRSFNYQTGLVLPDFELTDILGNKLKLSDKYGNFILLNFWSLDNPGSLQQLAEIKKLSKAQKSNNDFYILSINVDKDADKWTSYVKKNKLYADNLIQVNVGAKEHLGLYSYYKDSALPVNYLVDPSGVLGINKMPANSLISDLNRILSGDLFYRTKR